MAWDDWYWPPVAALVLGVWALAPLGLRVLQRGVVFIDLAVAQAAAAGALAALALGGHPAWWLTQASAVAGAWLAGAAVAWLSRRWAMHREALIGLVYVGSACLALLVARGDAHGAEHLHSLMAADVLWSGWREVGLLALAGVVVAVVGSARLGRDVWFYGVFGLVASLAVQVLGLYLVFTALIAPGLWQRAGWQAPVALGGAWLAAAAGLWASWRWDLPSGPLVALGLVAFGGLSVLWRPTIPHNLRHGDPPRD